MLSKVRILISASTAHSGASVLPLPIRSQAIVGAAQNRQGNRASRAVRTSSD